MLKKVTAYTSRPARAGEIDGVDYHFVSQNEFLAKAEAGDFLEWKEVHGNFYATPLADMEEMIASGLVPILKIDVQGALEVMAKRSDLVTIMLAPPSFEELERRIRERATDPPEKIEERLTNARDELAAAERYQHVVVNDDLQVCLAELDAILAGSLT